MASTTVATHVPRFRPRHDYPAVDGIRAIAVVAVLLYHFDLAAARGGFLGVDVFLVLSGYLITGQLVTRWVLGDSVSFRSFWAARARRLLPGLVVVLAATTAGVTLLDRAQLTLFRGDLTAAATYSSNWWYVAHQRSYFVAAGRPPVLEHLWSLAVEEQFYLVWPLVVAAVVLLVAATTTRIRLLVLVALAVGLASALVMALGSAHSGAPQQADPTRWYFGTDAHVTGLMLGAILALVRRGDGLGALGPAAHQELVVRRADSGRRSLGGFAACAVLLGMMSRTDEFAPWLYRFGFVAVAGLTLVVLATATRPGPLATVLARPVLRGLGRRSYVLYLWHWPVACFTRPGADLPISAPGAFALRLGLTLLLAEATYQWIELPVRRQGWRPAWRRLAASRIGACRVPTVIAVAGAALAAGMVLPAAAAPVGPSYRGAGAVYVAQPGRPSTARVVDPADSRVEHQPSGPPADLQAQQNIDPPRALPTVHRPSTAPPRPHVLPGSVDGLRSYGLVVYGDSVPLGAIGALAARFRTVTNDAAVGEQAWSALPQVISDARAGRLEGVIVLIHLGDNGIINPAQLATAVGAMSGAARVVLAVPFVPRPWQADNQATVRAAANGRGNVRLVPWASLARTHPGYLWDDGIHLTSSGQQAYADQVAAAAVQR